MRFNVFQHRKRHDAKYARLPVSAGVQSARPLNDGDRVIVYVSEDGDPWVRPMDEFADGRFTPIGTTDTCPICRVTTRGDDPAPAPSVWDRWFGRTRSLADRAGPLELAPPAAIPPPQVALPPGIALPAGVDASAPPVTPLPGASIMPPRTPAQFAMDAELKARIDQALAAPPPSYWALQRQKLATVRAGIVNDHGDWTPAEVDAMMDRAFGPGAADFIRPPQPEHKRARLLTELEALHDKLTQVGRTKDLATALDVATTAGPVVFRALMALGRQNAATPGDTL